MKIHETEATVTTIDTSVQEKGGEVLILATIATTERGTYCAGPPSHGTLIDHQSALEKFGQKNESPEIITRGYKSMFYLSPEENALVCEVR